MIKGIFCLLLFTGLSFIGCSEDAGTNPVGGGIGNNNGGGNVTFTVTAITNQGQGTTDFAFKPSVDVTVTTVVVSVPAENFTFTETNPNPTEVFTAAEGFQITDYTGVVTGQQWMFQVKGNIGTANGQAYDVTVNYTIP